MNCYIFDIHIDCCFLVGSQWEDGICFYTQDLVQVGPLNMICSRKLSRVKSKVRSISLDDVPINWWTEFSTWEDYRGLLRTGTILKIHEIVKNFSKPFETVEDIDAYIENIDENGNLEIGLSENNENIFQSFTIRASRKRLRRLKEIAAYNVGQCLSSDSDIEYLNLPHTLDVLVKKFINTYSGDYITDTCET